MSRSTESKFDPVVASLTPSQKRHIIQLYGGGDPQPGETWEPLPHLTPDQINLVMAEQKNVPQYPPSYATHGNTQAAMYHPYPPATQQPFMGPPNTMPTSAGHVYQQRHYQDPSRPPPAPYQHDNSCPPSSTVYPVAASGGHHTTDCSSNLFSLGQCGVEDMATDNDYSIW